MIYGEGIDGSHLTDFQKVILGKDDYILEISENQFQEYKQEINNLIKLIGLKSDKIIARESDKREYFILKNKIGSITKESDFNYFITYDLIFISIKIKN